MSNDTPTPPADEPKPGTLPAIRQALALFIDEEIDRTPTATCSELVAILQQIDGLIDGDADRELLPGETQSWVTCPICKESDMRCVREPHEGLPLIFCVNHACPSNVPSNNVPPPAHPLPEGFIDALAARLSHVSPDFIEQVKTMPRDELQRRVLIGCDYHGLFACCLDGIAEIGFIPGGGIDRCRDHKAIRTIVETLVKECPTAWDVSTAPRPKDMPIPAVNGFKIPDRLWLKFRADKTRGIDGIWEFEPYSGAAAKRDRIVEYARVTPDLSAPPEIRRRRFLEAFRTLCEAFDCCVVPTYQREPSAHDVMVVVPLDDGWRAFLEGVFLPTDAEVAGYYTTAKPDPSLKPSPLVSRDVTQAWIAAGPGAPRCTAQRAIPGKGLAMSRCMLPSGHVGEHHIE